MRKYKVTLFSFFIFLISSFYTVAQTSEETVEMADLLHSNGKIYIVVGVLAIIFTGIVIYLVRIDKKLSKLENKGGGEK